MTNRSRVLTCLALLCLVSACSTPVENTNQNTNTSTNANKPAQTSEMLTAAEPPAEFAFEFVAVDFVDARNGWIAARDVEQNVSAIFSTNDAGATWTKAMEMQAGVIQDVDFATRNEGWCVTNEGNVYRTGDGGKSCSSPTPMLRTWIC